MMKKIEFYLNPSRELIFATAKQRGWVIDEKDIVNFKEDSLLSSSRYTILAVADGETLSVNEGNHYPFPSGSGRAAQLFCETAIELGEKTYETFEEGDIARLFSEANDAIGRYNLESGRNHETINFWDTDLYSAAACLALIRDGILYWGSIADCGVTVIDNTGTQKLRTGEGWELFDARKPKDWDTLSIREKTVIRRREFRNMLGADGQKTGYGVLDGEETALKYLNRGSFRLESGDTVALYSDGMGPYFELPGFVELLVEWPEDMKERITAFEAPHETYKDLYRFHSEKSLIVLRYIGAANEV